MTYTEIEFFRKKASTKKDGIYTLRGYLYVVLDNRFIAYMEYNGDFYQVMGHFVTKLGCVKDKTIRRSEIKKWIIKEKEERSKI